MLNDTSPEWLANGIVNGSFDWSKATGTTFSLLLDGITLHDSLWCQTISQAENSLLLVFRLDSFWNKAFCHHQDEWPYLLLEISEVLCSFYGFLPEEDTEKTVSRAATYLLPDSKVAAWSSVGTELGIVPIQLRKKVKPPIHRTDIETLGGIYSCVHKEAIRILLYTTAGDLLPIDLSAALFPENGLAQKPLQDSGIVSRILQWFNA
ncbi:hypothetical protein KBK19_15495 [Microvirga sp. STR05]|uniref:Uncharacterized protein n=1 Tax=Hymenobacter duratus TaxID=2771356 RepID=A0ABR8JHW7_9BACT|nr:hypothetical protein [Hymenobacter duratus]MBD2716445.1 hypothetical protein [Hymenobacter duratus]MBR7951360.1 hypothetical protein [Microvirga sp. STR05]